MKYFDPRSSKEIDLKESKLFFVYIRRSQCAKRLIYSGTSIEDALDAYYSFKIFETDYKYLQLDTTEIIYRLSGTGVRKSYKGIKSKSNFAKKNILLTNTSLELVNRFNDICRTVKTVKGKPMSSAKMIALLMAKFCMLSDTSRDEIISQCTSELTRYELLSGGNNTKDIKEYLINTIKETDELL